MSVLCALVVFALSDMYMMALTSELTSRLSAETDTRLPGFSVTVRVL
jgi:hypothetical protein